MQRGDMAEVASGLIEQLFPLNNIGIIDIAARRNAERLHVQIHVFHLCGGAVELFVREAHHAALVDLGLPFADFFGIAAVGHTHVARKSELDRQVGVLGLVAGNSQLAHSPFGDVVATAVNAVLRIIALAGQSLYLVRIKSHHLPHSNVT